MAGCYTPPTPVIVTYICNPVCHKAALSCSILRTLFSFGGLPSWLGEGSQF